MSRAGRRKAIAILCSLGAFLPFSGNAQPPSHGRRHIALFGSGACQEFEWLPTECADERYPMQLIWGEFQCGAGGLVKVPAGKIVNNGWGGIGSRRLVGERLKPLPERLDVAWFSFAEDQFFGGIVELPHADLADMFRTGFSQPLTNRRVTWDKIIVGMGLGGWTSVWVSGSGVVRELTRARLDTKEVPWTRVIDNPGISRAAYVRSKLRSRLKEPALSQLIENGPPVAHWTRYYRRYRWHLIVTGMHVPQTMFLRSYNGERTYHEFSGEPIQALAIAPKQLQITWVTRTSSRLLTTIRFDEEEVFDAFDKASAASPDASTTKLRVEFTTRSRVGLSVENGAGRTSLTRASVEVRSLSSG